MDPERRDWWSALGVILADEEGLVAAVAGELGEAPDGVRASVLTATTIALGAAATLMLGILPGPLLDLAGLAGEFIR